MPTAETAARWVERYRHAWTSNDPDDIAALFSPDAVFCDGPFAEPIAGRDAIVADWLERRDEPGTWRFEFRVLAAGDDVAVIEGATEYLDPPAEYANLWLLRLDGEGRATRFTEWWQKKPQE